MKWKAFAFSCNVAFAIFLAVAMDFMSILRTPIADVTVGQILFAVSYIAYLVMVFWSGVSLLLYVLNEY